MTEVQENNDENIDEKPEKSNKKTKSFPNKVVIRKLPPNLTEESFIEMISPLPDLQDLYFCPADWSLGAEATSRAYIEFKNEEDVSIKIQQIKLDIIRNSFPIDLHFQRQVR